MMASAVRDADDEFRANIDRWRHIAHHAHRRARVSSSNDRQLVVSLSTAYIMAPMLVDVGGMKCARRRPRRPSDALGH